MKNLLLPALGALFLGLAACAGPETTAEGGESVAVASARLPEIRYYMIADA